MSKCLNPDCLTQNSFTTLKFCQKCGSKLLLKERYRAIKIIGEGGFGRTFLAIDEDKPSKPDCVIKQFLPQAQGTSSLEKASELFAQEAERLDELGKHPQIPELLAYFTQDNRQYLIQEFIEGLNLQQELTSKGNFNEEKIRGFLEDILPILQYVHENKVIHQDIKPENIIRRASDNKIFLVDFGASKVIENTRLSVTGTVIGSAQYTSPEQSMGKPQYCSDLYSLGVTCLHLLTGIYPFDLFDSGEGDWVWRNYLLNNPVSEELGQILDNLVKSGYKKRYQSADEVLSALNLTLSVKQDFSLSVSPQPKDKMPVSTTIIEQEEQNFIENLPNDVKLEMVYIPAGAFLMGSNEDSTEKPIHKVTFQQGFYMGKYPITQGQYIMRHNPSQYQEENKPIANVSWDDAQEFCKLLSEITDRKYTLPSEAQWEYACRAGSYTRYYFGNDESQLPDYAWYRDNSDNRRHPVGEKKPNAWGLYDMHGNVWEWCEDYARLGYYDTPTDGSPCINEYYRCKRKKILRGGSWHNELQDCRSAYRAWADYYSNDLSWGFRVVCS